MEMRIKINLSFLGGIFLVLTLLYGCGGGGGNDAGGSTPISGDSGEAVFVAVAGERIGGVIGHITIDDNIVVRPNTALTLNHTTVNGNVYVDRGAQLIANGASIIGNVQAYGASLVDLRQSTFIDGNVQGESTISVFVHEETFVGGNVQITQANAAIGTDALWVAAATVDGDVQAEKSRGGLRVTDSQIWGNLQLVENLSGPYPISDNRIDGDLQFFKNQGPGTITANIVQGNLQSKENDPRPVIGNNIVNGDLEDE